MALEISYEAWLAENHLKDDSFMLAVTRARHPRRPSQRAQRAHQKEMLSKIEEGMRNRARYNDLVAAGEIIDPARKPPPSPIDYSLEEYIEALTGHLDPEKYSTEAKRNVAIRRWNRAHAKPVTEGGE